MYKNIHFSVPNILGFRSAHPRDTSLTPTMASRCANESKKLEHTSNMQEGAHGLGLPPPLPIHVGVLTLRISPAPAEAFCMCSQKEKEKAHRGPYKGPSPTSHWCWLCFKKKDIENCSKVWGHSVLKWTPDMRDVASKSRPMGGTKRPQCIIHPPKDSPCKKQKRVERHDLMSLMEEINKEGEEERAAIRKKVQKGRRRENRARELLAGQAGVGWRLRMEVKKEMRKLRRLGSTWPENDEDWTDEDWRSSMLFDALHLDMAPMKNCCRRWWFSEKVAGLLPAAMSKGDHSDLLIALDLQVDKRKRNRFPDVTLLGRWGLEAWGLELEAIVSWESWDQKAQVGWNARPSYC